jgi:hypothetical protein
MTVLRLLNVHRSSNADFQKIGPGSRLFASHSDFRMANPVNTRFSDGAKNDVPACSQLR